MDERFEDMDRQRKAAVAADLRAFEAEEPEACLRLAANLERRAAKTFRDALADQARIAREYRGWEAYLRAEVRQTMAEKEAHPLLKEAARLRRTHGEPDGTQLDAAAVDRAAAVPLASLLPTEGKRLAGKEWHTCPFHGEKTASFAVFPDNHAHCFGCGYHAGDAIDLYRSLTGCGFREAVERLGVI